MVWASYNFLSARIRFACDLFHPYKKLLEDTWRKPEFFYPFFAPLTHLLHPDGPVYPKPKLKEIESFVTALTLVRPDWREKFHSLLPLLEGEFVVHFRNILLILDFFLPIVSVCTVCVLA